MAVYYRESLILQLDKVAVQILFGHVPLSLGTWHPVLPLNISSRVSDSCYGLQHSGPVASMGENHSFEIETDPDYSFFESRAL